MKIALVAIALIIACVCPGSAETRKKLIEYGWDVPNTAYVREHITEMEKIAFDGIVIKIDAPVPEQYPRGLGWCVFKKGRFNAEDWQFAIDDLKATKFERFTDNFMQLIAFPGEVDWFDPEWDNVAHNAGVIARIAKQGGCKGIMFDPEAYQTRIWQYSGLPEEWRKNHTFDEYRVKVKECGKQFIRAINAEFPDVKILALYGPYCPLWMTGGHMERDPEGQLYGLLRDFYDGVLEVATPGTILVDGFESSYGYKTLDRFEFGRKVMLEQSKELYSDPKAFDAHVRAGFGIWADWNTKKCPFSLTDTAKNYFVPEQLAQSIGYAMQTSDEYVWVYTEKMRWWNKLNAPKPYIYALRVGKKGPRPDFVPAD